MPLPLSIARHVAAALIVFAIAAPALARDLTEDERGIAMDFAMHDAIFTLYHETGHLLVGELGLPVLGKEEDAADALAVILILNYTPDADDRYNILADAADGWYLNAQNSTGEGVDDLSFYDDHSLDIQRAYAVVCMIVGADPAEFGEVADIYEMDAERQEACGPVYAQSESAWMTLLDPHLGTTDAAAIEIVYDDAGDYGDIRAALEEWEIVEALATLLAENFVLPEPIKLRVAQCGEANAFYDPDAREITYCYEMGAEMYDLYAKALLAEEE